MPSVSATEPASPGASTRVPYRVKLHQVECCNCNHGCNCQFEGIPNDGHCEFFMGFEAIEGRYGDVPLEGVRFIIVAKYPGAIHEGNGHVALFVDERASGAQVDAVANILSGKMGGMPWEALAGTVGRFEGPVRKPIEMKVNGTESSYRIPGVLEMQQRPIRDVVTGEPKEVHIVYPKGGFLWDDGSVCTTSAMSVSYGDLRFEHPGAFSSTAVANWTNQR